jgi:hypothetical protein
MELTAEQFAEIVGHLNGIASPDSSKDKRRATRIERRTRIAISPIGSGGAAPAEAAGAPVKPVVVMVKNLSSRGMAMVADREMKVASQFMLKLAREDARSGAAVELLCTVVHCEEVSDGVFSVGAEFTCIVGQAIENVAGGDAKRIQDSILD